MTIVFSPSSFMFTIDRSERPTNREISWVRPPSFPFTLSRSERVWVARGNIAYSDVTHPFPLSFNHRGTPGVKEATQSTRVFPNSTSTEPSAWSSQLRVNLISRRSALSRPSILAISSSPRPIPDVPLVPLQDRESAVQGS